MKCQKDFWETVHKISFKRKSVYNNISVDSWFQHFRALLEKDVVFDFDDEVVENSESFLNRTISEEEVLLALSKLKNKKVAGPDGIIGEMLKNSGSYVLDFLVKFLMLCLRKESFRRDGLNLLYCLCLRKVMLTILIITEVFHYVMLVVRFTVQLLILDYKSGFR